MKLTTRDIHSTLQLAPIPTSIVPGAHPATRELAGTHNRFNLLRPHKAGHPQASFGIAQAGRCVREDTFIFRWRWLIATHGAKRLREGTLLQKVSKGRHALDRLLLLLLV